MNAVDISRAVASAREHVGAPEDAPTSWRLVRRLDGGPDYLLVGITTITTGWVVAVTLTGDLQSRAEDPAGARAWWVDVPEELVWDNGVGTRSMLYPLRRGQHGFLDHAGHPIPPRGGNRG